MTDLKVNPFTLPQPSLLRVDFSEINSEIKKICFDLLEEENKESHNQFLAGNLKHEYVAPEEIQNLITEYIPKVINDVELSSCWVNFQKKYEFNPNHNHGGDYSFVWWVNIPYDIQEELSLDFVKNSRDPSASKFSFTYPDFTGMLKFYSIPVSKRDEGILILFPSKLVHTVYPFYTSDDYRISISGNLLFKK